MAVAADDDPGRIEVIIECFGFTKELRTEENALLRILSDQMLRVSDRNRGFDHDGRLHSSFRRLF